MTPTGPTFRSAARCPRAWATLLGLFTVLLWLDLATKAWTFEHLASRPLQLDRHLLLASPEFDPIGPDERRALIPGGILDARLVLNPGAVFGIGANHRWFFIAFTFLALSMGLFVFARHTEPRQRLAHTALALILAGGAGNLYDRLAIGRVRDFLHLLPGHSLPEGWAWPGTGNTELFPWVFNVADVLLLVGMVLLMRHMRRRQAAG